MRNAATPFNKVRKNKRLKFYLSMADESINEKVKSIIVDQLGVTEDQVTPEAKFIEDLGADSLDTVELVMAFEDEFGISVPDEEAENLTSVGAVYDYVKAKKEES